MDLRRWLIGLVAVIGLAGCGSTVDSGATPAAAGTSAPAAGSTANATTTASGTATSSATTMSSATTSSASATVVPPTRTIGTAPSSGVVPSRTPGARMTLTGTVQAGVEASCLVLEDEKTGLRVNLSGGEKAVVKLGSRIIVVGQIRSDLMSYCQQGPIFVVISATAD